MACPVGDDIVQIFKLWNLFLYCPSVGFIVAPLNIFLKIFLIKNCIIGVPSREMLIDERLLFLITEKKTILRCEIYRFSFAFIDNFIFCLELMYPGHTKLWKRLSDSSFISVSSTHNKINESRDMIRGSSNF